MDYKDIIVRQAAEIFELRDKLAEANEVKQHYFNQAARSVPVRKPSPVEEHNLLADLIRLGARL